MVSELGVRFAESDVRALARTISLVEGDAPSARAVLAELRSKALPQPRRVGLTGAPGAGKSSLINALIGAARSRGDSVAVLAVDPSSPFSGGALLGDRLRMDAHLLDPQVYVRSMAARGHLGGLSPTAADVAWLMGAFGFDEVLIETVGTGQSELEVLSLVDTTVVVLTPDSGDSIQLDKAGMMEIADIYVVNKSDLAGADAFVRDIRTMLGLGTRTSWVPPVIATTAHEPNPAINGLWDAISSHRQYLDAHPEGRKADLRRTREAAAALVGARARAWALRECGQDGFVFQPGERAESLAERLMTLANNGWNR